MKVQPGITAREVERLAGKPKRIARQVLYLRHVEQWTYEMPGLEWVELECSKGKELRVKYVSRE